MPTVANLTMERPDRISRREPGSKKTLHCCCGRPECLILKRNCSVLETVEKDVHTAAQLGQALLSRHEAYMAEAEHDRFRLNARIDRLQLDKDELENQNSLKVQDNLALIEQLEQLNNTVSDADAKIRMLEATLLSSQQAIRLLEGTAARATQAERHLRELSEEQERLQDELQSSQEEARSHSYRFKDAQRSILNMQDQLDRMEREARQERERHARIVEKMEHQREIEKQLDAAALRLKGAAASKAMRHQSEGESTIVGHFARDLLQDKGSLQVAIAELREMLLDSNDEIQSLRDQLLCHRPLSQEKGNDPSPSTFKAELEPLLDSPLLSRGMLVHHHYHIAGPDGRPPKRKRQGLFSGNLSPGVQSSTNSASLDRWRSLSTPASSSSRSCLDGLSTPSIPISRSWNAFSTPSSAISSALGSPQSSDRDFFAVHAALDMEPLASPSTSFDPISPTWQMSHRKRISETSTFQSLFVVDVDSAGTIPHQTHHKWASTTICEEDDKQCHQPRKAFPLEVSTSASASVLKMTLAEELGQIEKEEEEENAPSLQLRRIACHERPRSVASARNLQSGLSRPSPMMLVSLGAADVVLTDVNAEPTLSRSSLSRDDAFPRNHFPNFQVSRLSSALTPDAISSQTPRRGPGNFGKWTGWRPWAGSRVSATTTIREEDDPERAPGINQPGTVPGFPRYWVSQKRKGAPAKVTVEHIDRDALSESLAGITVSEEDVSL